MLQIGLYEQIVNKLISSKLNELSRDKFYIKETSIDKAEAAKLLTTYVSNVINYALNSISGEKSIEKQIEFSNKIINLIKDELLIKDLEEDIIEIEGRILSAVLLRANATFSDFESRIKEITPYTRLSHSELFTGNHAGIPLDVEIKKEILSSDKICLLVSFIKWTGIIIFKKELEEFTNNGGELKIITTSYLGATDLKAIEFLSQLPNTQIKISYNTKHERLHAKAYLFLRNTGFNTGYIGSSNISRSALTSGLEWNMKVTSKEVSHIINKFQKTFDTYWEDKEFEQFDIIIGRDKLQRALNSEKYKDTVQHLAFFDITPFPYQEEILAKLEAERTSRKHYKNLIVAATGTGKTVIAAFDYKRFMNHGGKSRLLFVAHRREILEHARVTFQGVLKDANFGELWVDGIVPSSYEYVFASVQTLNSQLDRSILLSEYFDYIVIDEVHHLAANSYRPIINHFSPKILLGLTATPYRMDGEDIIKDFSNRIAAEIRLNEALNRKLLCPFQYFGISDQVDLTNVGWQNGKYIASELTRVYTNNDKRVSDILNNIDKYLRDINDVRALCFCVSQEHAEYMAEKFLLANLKADYLVSSNSERRGELRRKFKLKEINYLFVVDIFNEGVDIPEIDTLLFLRPTESITVFLQQLGRGLRLADGKDCVTVLDFVGNARLEYDFESKFRSIIGKINHGIEKEIEDQFPHVPLGCTIILEKKAKEIILKNIKHANDFRRKTIIRKIKEFNHNTELKISIENFSIINRIPVKSIYKSENYTWTRLCSEAGILDGYLNINESEIYRAIVKKWMSTSSESYFNFILKLAKNKFQFDINSLSIIEKQMCLMLYYDVWQEECFHGNIQNALQILGKNDHLVSEIIEIISILKNRIENIEANIQLPFSCPLKVHGRYTRDQILSAIGLHTYEKKSPNIEGVAYNSVKNVEALFIDLYKSDKDFSPSTMYDDYAISDTLFHWQSQNKTRPDKGVGLSYINHKKLNKIILLFVRERKNDAYGHTMGYVFLGEGILREFNGSKPMSIVWELSHRIPSLLWSDFGKMAVG